MTEDRIWLSTPHMSGNEQKYIDEAFKSNWIAPLGPHVDAFERDICDFTGSKFAAVLSSGTAAIHLALVVLGVKPGDEVICQSMTFSASANPISYLGATPVFIDSELDTWNMNPAMLEIAIKDRLSKGKNVKAIIPVHLYGMPAKMNEILSIANKYRIPVVEDAAEALGSTLFGRAAGTFGAIGIYSFNGNKIITTSGGGALVSNYPEFTQKAKFLATQAREDMPHYEHTQIGYNYRMSNVCAAIGLGQMEVLNERVGQRRANHKFYVEQFADLPEIEFLKEPQGFYSNHWLTCIRINRQSEVTREDLRLALEAENIDSRPLWKPMHMQPVFSNCPYYGNGVSEELFETGLCLPSGSSLTIAELFKVSNIVRSVFDNVGTKNMIKASVH
ncbi:aminotransferase class I/II-fold pyridoxal phosphate-dependent enzyme [Mucilaginibacter agri]|uniref:GDP-perosamine synthase n=1 Tax=Mucilaginibacter agri TaxID=2695265 RepID=A0A965ZIE9_9SPHI|nr:aminotransferase class I/II-fold pyridoxal phosphate-dependent enzyme [Mucilaginibacter agri]NCD70559.1 aminotransferase class I/II-fold pyridoxal phosphate-dependent enzyme [Mucilaginibacter agri]